MTKQEIKCLREHLNNIDNSMLAIKSMLGADLPGRALPRKSKAKEREEKYRQYLRK